MTSTSNTNIDFEQIQTIISNIIKNTIDDLKLTLSTNLNKKFSCSFKHCYYQITI